MDEVTCHVCLIFFQWKLNDPEATFAIIDSQFLSLYASKYFFHRANHATSFYAVSVNYFSSLSVFQMVIFVNYISLLLVSFKYAVIIIPVSLCALIFAFICKSCFHCLLLLNCFKGSCKQP